MRLQPAQIDAIRRVAHQTIGPQVTIWLFGSRANSELRGGDIDLLLETDTIIANRAQAICAIGGALWRALGDRKIDILIKDPRTPDAPIFKIAKETGVML